MSSYFYMLIAMIFLAGNVQAGGFYNPTKGQSSEMGMKIADNKKKDRPATEEAEDLEDDELDE